ncbi:MAG: hypothetical protein VXW15_06710, partial [Bdellovibrionota bacterium]|nr:hypothetical protein [Bdellovibrionota bacterium]
MEDLKKKVIKEIVENFYREAVKDFLIGYHFRKIQETPSEKILYPELSAFSKHIPRIIKFWEIQLIGSSKDSKKTQHEKPFNLISSHAYLNIRKGELHRFTLLFDQTIEAFRKEKRNLTKGEVDLIEKWKEKLSLFKQSFLDSKTIFS